LAASESLDMGALTEKWLWGNVFVGASPSLQ
jgi:hypothetical protein